MLQAIDVVTGGAVVSLDATRQGRYLCPECHALVGLRAGSCKAPYFAHYARRLCSLSQPESPRHRMIKLSCKSFFAPLEVEWEIPVGSRRADVLVARKFVVECQVSPLSPQEWSERTANHNRHGYPVLWLWDVKRLCRKNTLAEAKTLERSGRPILAPAEIRRCHDEGGLIQVADKHELVPCRLKETKGDWPRYLPEATFFPQALRTMSFLPSPACQDWREVRGEASLRLVRCAVP